MSQSIQDAAVREIDGHRFEVCKLDPMVSLLMLRRLMAAVGPSLGAMLNGVSLKALSSSSVDLGRAIGELFDRLDEPLVDDLVKTWSAVSFIDGKPLKDVFSAVFRGKTAMLLEWLYLCVTGEYEDAVGKARSAIDRAIAEVAQRLESKSQSTSPGSGASTT